MSQCRDGWSVKLAVGQLHWRCLSARLCAVYLITLCSKLALGLHKILYLCKLVVKIQAIFVCQSVRRFDCLPGHNLFYWKLNFLEIDRCLTLSVTRHEEMYIPTLTGISGVSNTYAGTHLLPASRAIASLTLFTKSWVNFLPGFMSRKSMTLSSISCGLR